MLASSCYARYNWSNSIEPRFYEVQKSSRANNFDGFMEFWQPRFEYVTQGHTTFDAFYWLNPLRLYDRSQPIKPYCLWERPPYYSFFMVRSFNSIFCALPFSIRWNPAFCSYPRSSTWRWSCRDRDDNAAASPVGSRPSRVASPRGRPCRGRGWSLGGGRRLVKNLINSVPN